MAHDESKMFTYLHYRHLKLTVSVMGGMAFHFHHFNNITNVNKSRLKAVKVGMIAFDFTW
jgi:hypothetical protein